MYKDKRIVRVEISNFTQLVKQPGNFQIPKLQLLTVVKEDITKCCFNYQAIEIKYR